MDLKFLCCPYHDKEKEVHYTRKEHHDPKPELIIISHGQLPVLLSIVQIVTYLVLELVTFCLSLAIVLLERIEV